MSYDIHLLNQKTKEVIQFEEPLDIKGGNYQLGGTTEAWLNVTYNYSRYFYRTMGKKGIRTIYGMTGQESIPILISAIEQLCDNQHDEDYWEPTEGNAKTALRNLLRLAELCPTGIWDGD